MLPQREKACPSRRMCRALPSARLAERARPNRQACTENHREVCASSGSLLRGTNRIDMRTAVVKLSVRTVTLGSIMLIKTLAFHSLSYVLGITSLMALHPAIPSPNTPAIFQSDTPQIANRSAKSDRLPIRQPKPQVNDEENLHLPRQITPVPKLKSGCKPPIDIVGRCFADAKVNNNVT
jgi:hypothetical protein